MSDKKSKIDPTCASCPHPASEMICMEDSGSSHKGCPTMSGKDLLEKANSHYTNQDTHDFAKQASIQEASCYVNRHERPYVMQPTKTRLQEIMEFAGRMGYSRLGLAFCVGLKKEAAIVEDLLKKQGFYVVSVCCKAGRTSKDLIDIEDKDRIYQGTDESMCNPIFQAHLLNDKNTDFNLLLGLCVGHDSLFFKHADAHTTVLAVKDRVTGHNPLAAIYLSESYYRKLGSANRLDP
jgi:uncharacterized metal-binding protein